MPTNSITSVFKADTSGFDKSLKQTRSLVEATFSDYKSTLTKANSAQEKLTRTTREHAAALKPLTTEAEKLYQKQADGIKLSKKEADRLKGLQQQIRAMTNVQKLRERELRKETIALNQLAAAQKRYGRDLEKQALAATKAQAVRERELGKQAAIREREIRKEVAAFNQRAATREREIHEEAVALKQLAAAKMRYGIVLKSVAGSQRKEVSARKENVTSLRKENAERRALGTTLVRHIRRLESLAVAYYAVTRAYQSSFGAGIQLNREYQNMELGLSALLAAKTSVIDVNGREVDSFLALQAAQASTKDTLTDIKKAALDTPATFSEMVGFYQQAIGHALAAGDSFGGSIDDISENTITLTKRMSSLGASVGMSMDLINEEIRSLMSGDVSRDSKLALILFGSPTAANAAIKEAKTQTGGLAKLMDDVLKPFAQLEGIMTYDKQMNHLLFQVQEIQREMSKPIFNDLQAAAKGFTEYLKERGGEIAQTFRELYSVVKTLASGVKYAAAAYIVFKASGWIVRGMKSLTVATKAASITTMGLAVRVNMTTAAVWRLKAASRFLATNAWFVGLVLAAEAAMYFADNVQTLDERLDSLKELSSSEMATRILELNKKLANREITGTEMKELSRLSRYYEEVMGISEKALKANSDIDDLTKKSIALYNSSVWSDTDKEKLLGRIMRRMEEIYGVELKIKQADIGGIVQGAFATLNPELAKIAKINEKYAEQYDKLVKNKAVKADILMLEKAWAKEVDAAVGENKKATKSNVDTSKEQYLAYYEAIGDYAAAWAIREEKLRSANTALTGTELKKLIRVSKVAYFDKMIPDVKEAAAQIKDIWANMADSMYQSMDDNFFDLLMGKFDDLGDWLKKFGRDLIKDFATPLARNMSGALSGMVGGLIGLPASAQAGGLSDVLSQAGLSLVGGQWVGGGETAGQPSIIVDTAGNVVKGGGALGQDVLSNIASAKSIYAAGQFLTSPGAAMGNASTWLLKSGLPGSGYLSSAAGGASQLLYGGAVGVNPTLATQVGYYGTAGLLGGLGGYAVGSLGDKLFGTDTKAGALGAAGGAIGTIAGTILSGGNPLIGGLVGAGLGSVLGGMFGSKKTTGYGYQVGEGGIEDLTGLEFWKKKSWFSSSKGAEQFELDSTQRAAIEGVFNSYDYLLDQLGSARDMFVDAGQYKGEALVDEMASTFLEQFTGTSDVSGLIASIRSYADSIDSTVTDVLTSSFASFVSSKRTYQEWYYNLTGQTEELLKYRSDYLSADVESLMKSLGVSGITAGNYLSEFEAAVKTSPTTDVINQWQQLGEALMKSTDAATEYENALTRTVSSVYDPMLALLNDRTQMYRGLPELRAPSASASMTPPQQSGPIEIKQVDTLINVMESVLRYVKSTDDRWRAAFSTSGNLKTEVIS